MTGRKPKPTALKAAAGNPGKRPLNRREPKPQSGLPPCPAWLKGEGRKEYRRLGRLLVDMGVMTTVDRTSFVMRCEAWGRYVDARAQVARLGTVVKTANGNLIQNPYLPVMNKALEQVAKFDAEFGLTPSSRSRVQVQAQEAGLTLAELLFADVQEFAIDGEENEEHDHAER